MKYIHSFMMRWKDSIKQELTLKNFGLEHDQPHLFVTSQWGSKSFYILWTMFAAIYHAVWIVIEPMLKEVNPYYFIFLTNQGYLFLTFTCMYHCVLTMYVHCWRLDILEGECKYMPWYIKVVWIMTTVSNVIALVITIAFYALLRKNTSSAFSIEKHALNSVYIIINTSITAMPVRIHHMYQAVFVGIMYAVFSLIYQFTGGGAIYSVLNWNNMPNTIILVCCIMFIFIPILHFTVYGIYRFRLLIASKFCNKVKDYKLNLDEEKTPKLPDLYIRHTSFS